MKKSRNIAALLKPLFEENEVAMKPASKTSLNLFQGRAVERKVPGEVIAQLSDFYTIVDGIPCLDSLDIHRCDDLVLFEWWGQQELWLGQRDFYTLRWSAAKAKFCVGDADNVSFSPSDEYVEFADALHHLLKLYEPGGNA